MQIYMWLCRILYRITMDTNACTYILTYTDIYTKYVFLRTKSMHKTDTSLTLGDGQINN